MAVSDSDLSTFKSALKKENVPDFTIICGDHSWRVHSHLFAKHSKTFIGIFEEGATAGWTTSDSPLLIAHLILWIYTGNYGDLVGEANVMGVPPPDIDIDELMERGSTLRASDKEHDLFVPVENEWLPETLDAKMYLLGGKYGLEELKEKAGSEMRDMLMDADFDTVFFLPLLAEFFVATKATDVAGEHRLCNEHNITTPIGSPVGSAEVDLRQATPPVTPLIGNRSSISASPAPLSKHETYAISPSTDAKVWASLVDRAATDYEQYQPWAIFQKVMLHNSQFLMDVTNRLQQKCAEMRKVVARKDHVISGLKARDKPAPKRIRKRKAEIIPETAEEDELPAKKPRKTKEKESSVD